MKSSTRLMALIVAVLLLFCACSSATGTKVSDERVWSDAQRVYRNSSLVVMGKCVRSHINEDGVTCYDLLVDEVLAGTAARGDLIHCTDGAMKENETYLLYLGDDDAEVYYSEDTSGFTLLTDGPLPVNGEGEVVFSGVKLSLSAIRENIAEQNAVITAPSETYYYKDLASLTNASEEIFIGRVAQLPRLADTRFRSDSEGTSVENALPASVMQVEVYGSIKGTHRYGDMLQVVYCPALSDDMTDAATLKSLTYNAGNATAPEKDGIYLFFLVNSPDDKQSYYFGVNPIQGLALLDREDRLHVTYLNRALSGYYSLDKLVRDIRAILDS